MDSKNRISPERVARIRTQGYTDQTAEEISDLAVGNRFAYQLCTTILVIGVITANISILLVMMATAFLSVILPNHPFDYIFNHLLSKPLNRPKLPPRSVQLKFTCFMATLWIGSVILSFAYGYMTSGYILGGLLICTATLVSTMDICIPSMLYNAIMGIQVNVPLRKA